MFEALSIALTATLACFHDLGRRRIPNVLTFGSAATALMWAACTGGLSGFAWSVSGWLVGCAVLLPVFLLRGMGAGDVKLLGAFGAWLGPVMVLWVAAYGAIAGGVLAVLVAAWHGYLRKAIFNVGYVLWFWRMAGPRPVPDFTLDDAGGPRLPYAVPLGLGVVAALWLR